ncbi:hypothetical protein NPIL_608321 [Nephila pilipes]|uniref:Uncharacterized protein n=1 Tax=Nephila pilipes TaxID=299642 RepID=A0A8X6MW49_NEPPI|nr:hypothetical protein NPIL_608321 [Nephila pilipes]
MVAITSESTKFLAVVAALISNVLLCVKDIIKSTPEVGSYGAFRIGQPNILPSRAHHVQVTPVAKVSICERSGTHWLDMSFLRTGVRSINPTLEAHISFN